MSYLVKIEEENVQKTLGAKGLKVLLLVLLFLDAKHLCSWPHYSLVRPAARQKKDQGERINRIKNIWLLIDIVSYQVDRKGKVVPELKIHELRAETYNGMIRLLKPGCRTVVLIVDRLEVTFDAFDSATIFYLSFNRLDRGLKCTNRPCFVCDNYITSSFLCVFEIWWSFYLWSVYVKRNICYCNFLLLQGVEG